MKTVALTILIAFSAILSSTLSGQAELASTLRIPQGRGQYVEVQTPAKTATVAASKTCAHHGHANCPMDQKSACCHS